MQRSSKSFSSDGGSKKKTPPRSLSKPLGKSMPQKGRKESAPKVAASSQSMKKASGSKRDFMGLETALLKRLHHDMVKSRVLEERLIKIYRAGESFFWIGAPGEEAWGVPLGLHVRKGQGLAYDFVHLHYRGTPTLIAMGMPMIDSIRLMMNRSTDPSTGGRNFSNHYCFPQWNVAPVTSPIEVQYPIACGTAHAQKRFGKGALSVVTGGDAGTAEGDFASALILASRRGQELPLLMTVQNNGWGISTTYEGQHGEKFIADRARGFQMRARTLNGNDPVETYLIVKEEMEYIRKTGKPSFLEAFVSRLNGHSSATGANKVESEIDPVSEFEIKLLRAGVITEKASQQLWAEFEAEGVHATEQARLEPVPTAKSIWDHTYVGSENADWRKF